MRIFFIILIILFSGCKKKEGIIKDQKSQNLKKSLKEEISDFYLINQKNDEINWEIRSKKGRRIGRNIQLTDVRVKYRGLEVVDAPFGEYREKQELIRLWGETKPVLLNFTPYSSLSANEISLFFGKGNLEGKGDVQFIQNNLRIKAFSLRVDLKRDIFVFSKDACISILEGEPIL
jgi:hypothetical protein